MTAVASGVPAQEAAQRPRFRATVSRVTVDVIVTDADGNFVTDLDADDFDVFEDGERQEILSLQLVDLVAGQVRTLGDTDELEPDSLRTDSSRGLPASDFGASGSSCL